MSQVEGSKTNLAQALAERLGQLGSKTPPERISYASDFTRMLIQGTIADWQEYQLRRDALIENVAQVCNVPIQESRVLTELAESPRYRGFVDRREQDAFLARFGSEVWQQFRSRNQGEIDLRGFPERYGPQASLRLLDTMLRILVQDGTLSPRELRRAEEAAIELGIDTGVLCQLVRKHDPRYGQKGSQIPLKEDILRIGCNPSSDVILVDNQPHRERAELVRDAQGWSVMDVGSERATLLNGRSLDREKSPVQMGDEIRIGSYVLQLQHGDHGVSLFARSEWESAPLSIQNLSRYIRGTPLIDGVSFTAFQGEVIAVVGPSGAGKTTLLNAIVGIAPADSGKVLYRGKDFHAQLAADRSLIGVVPQDDIVLPELTVEESLGFGGRLRFGPKISPTDLMGEVDRVLSELGISHIRHSRIGDALRRGISGGQRKRVNLGQELLTRTTRVLFLDEPTSGLDPRAAQDIVRLVRQLADRGRIVFLVTHDMSPQVMAQIDHLMVLAPGGRLAWFGPPAEACRYFQVETVDAIFNGFTRKSPEEWAAAWRGSLECRKYVLTREQLSATTEPTPTPNSGFVRPNFAGPTSQLSTLIQRYARVKMRDFEGIRTLVIQPFIVAGVLAMVFKEPTTNMMFVVSLSCLWFGMSASVRELIADRVVWNRERRVGVGVIPYVGSKIMVLAGMVMSQCITLAALISLTHFVTNADYKLDLVMFMLVTVLTGWMGMSIGMAVSSRSTSSEQAVGSLPLLLIPQITFSGLLVYVKHMWPAIKWVTYLNPLRFAFEAIMKVAENLAITPQRGGDAKTEWQSIGTGGELYNIGFKGDSTYDVGIPMAQLGAIMLGITAACLLISIISVKRREA